MEMTAEPAACSDASGSPEANRHPAVFDDDRHTPLPHGVRQHPREAGLILLDVDVFERDVPPLIVVTGGLRIGSGVFAEDVDHTNIVRSAARAGASTAPRRTSQPGGDA
jgi:hypothetical protein